MASGKARAEHRVVIDVLRSALAPVCVELDVPEEPSVMSLRNVSHLATRITGRLAPATPETALELVARIHPTPAVGGDPTPTALRYLVEVEGFERGRYAGPVGWVDARGDGAWAVGIRCAEVDGAHARIFAGNGVVAGSRRRADRNATQVAGPSGRPGSPLGSRRPSSAAGDRIGGVETLWAPMGIGMLIRSEGVGWSTG